MSGVLPLAAIDRAALHLETTYPQEGGGLVLTGSSGWVVVPVRNVSSRPDTCFELEPRMLLRELARPGRSLAVLFHSHCDAEPELSAADRHAAAPAGEPLYPGVSQLVISVRGGRAVSFAEHRWTPSGWEELQRGHLPQQ